MRLSALGRFYMTVKFLPVKVSLRRVRSLWKVRKELR